MVGTWGKKEKLKEVKLERKISHLAYKLKKKRNQ